MCILQVKCTQSQTSTHARTCTHFLNPFFLCALPMSPPWEKTPLRFGQLRRCWRQRRTHKWWSGSLGCDVAPACRGIYRRIACQWCCRSLLRLMLRETRAENHNMTNMSSSNATGAERNSRLLNILRPLCVLVSSSFSRHRLTVHVSLISREPLTTFVSMETTGCWCSSAIDTDKGFCFIVRMLFMLHLFVWYLLVRLVYGVMNG